MGTPGPCAHQRKASEANRFQRGGGGKLSKNQPKKVRKVEPRAKENKGREKYSYREGNQERNRTEETREKRLDTGSIGIFENV